MPFDRAYTDERLDKYLLTVAARLQTVRIENKDAPGTHNPRGAAYADWASNNTARTADVPTPRSGLFTRRRDVVLAAATAAEIGSEVGAISRSMARNRF